MPITILKYFWRALDRIILYKHCVISHKYYLYKKYKLYWKKLSNNIMYDLKFKNAYCNDINETSKIFLKVEGGNENDIISIDLSIIVQNGNLEYVQNIVYHFSFDKVAVFSLTNIPIKKISVIDNKIVTSIDSYYFHINQICVNGKCTRENVKCRTYPVVFHEELNGEFIYKWGAYWNLSLYKRARENFAIAIAGAFLEDAILRHKEIRINLGFFQQVRAYFVRMLIKDGCLRFLFWSALALNIAKVTSDGDLKSKYFCVENCRKLLRLKYLSFSCDSVRQPD